jgi:hypothetical protein
LLRQFGILAILFLTVDPFFFRPVQASPTTWSVSLDANSPGQTDTTIESSATDQKSFRIGAVINATGSSPLTGVYGWQLTINYNRSIFIPQGDPNPLATAGNSLGLYPDGASNTVLFGAQTTTGTVNWAGLVSAGGAFGSFRVNSTLGRVTAFFTMLGSSPAAAISANTLLANVNFEILNKTNSPQIFTLSNIIFVDINNKQITGVVAGASVTETVTNAPPYATFAKAPAPKVGPYAYSFNAKSSSDVDDTIPNPGGYFWDFGDGTQDLGLTGSMVTHNYTSPSAFNVTLRVQDSPGETGASRDSLGNVIVNAQPSHMFLDPSPSGQLGGATTPSVGGCISLSGALNAITSSSKFLQLNPLGTYKYEGYGTGTDGAICRMVLFFTASSGDRIEGIVNPDGVVENVVPVSGSGIGGTAMQTYNGGTSTTPNWSGYEVRCEYQNIVVWGCNPPGEIGVNSSDQIEGAVMSFTLPTASPPTGVGINGKSCCWMSEWVGAGNTQGASTGPLIQAGVNQGTNNFAGLNNVAWYEINYASLLSNGTIASGSLKSNDNIVWPCPGGLSNGDTVTVLVNETKIDYANNWTYVDFRWTDMNHSSLKCRLDYPTQVQGEFYLSYAYYIVESPHDKNNSCNYVSGVKLVYVCQLPAFEDPISESAWLIRSCCQTQPIDKIDYVTIYNDLLSQCSGHGPYNLATTSLSGNSWNSSWVTSAQSGSSLSQCLQGFTLDPDPNYLLVQPGTSVFSNVAVNAVGSYSSTGLSFTTSMLPSSGLTVSCSNYQVSANTDPAWAPCKFTASTPGMYNVTITGTTTQPQGSPMSYNVSMTVVVPSVPVSYLSPYSVDGFTVSLQGGFYNNAGTLTGLVVVSAVNSTGSLIFRKSAIMNLATYPGPSSSRFVMEVSTSPYWLSVECSIQGSSTSCSLSRTIDINHDGWVNIADLALVAICFGSWAWACTPTNSGSPISYCAPQCALSVDLNADNIINIYDLTDIALWFGVSMYSSNQSLYPP